MSLPSSLTTPILEVPISRLSAEEALRLCETRLGEGKGGYVCFVNVHVLSEASRDAELREILSSAFLAMPDGMPLVWVSGLFGDKIQRRVCGPDFMAEVLTNSQERIYGFIGGAKGQAEEISRRFGIKAVVYSPPFRPFSRENALKDWNEFLARADVEGMSRPRWVWVGLGAPKQERWMEAVAQIAPDTIFFGVGAAFDFLAGTKARAPAWMRGSGLEWLHRFASEPGRLWKRYLSTHSRFGYELIKHLKNK